MAARRSSAEIEVVLSDAHGGRSFDDEHTFFGNELEQAAGIVWRLAEKARQARLAMDYEDETDPGGINALHQHDLVTVMGRRGVGKTSFILSLSQYLQRRQNDGSRPRRSVIPLPPIDPTLMEDTDTFLALVIANVLKWVEQQFRNDDWPESVRTSLDELGQNFGVLAPASVQEAQWKEVFGDPGSFVYDVLRKARSGINLSRSVNRFLLACVQECKVDAFLQPIDDVDTALERGWPVLETLRKYLASPFMITVLSGDEQLYEVMVRQEHLNKLKSLITIDEHSNSWLQDQNHRQVAQLVDQYLMKIMPPHQRISLPIIAEEIVESAIRGKELIKVKYQNRNGAEEVESFSELFMWLSRNLLHFPNAMNQGDIGSLQCLMPEVSGVLRKLIPRYSRSLIQFMEAICTSKCDGQDSEKKQGDLLEKLSQVFAITLSRRNITPRDMIRLRRGEHLEWLTHFCLLMRKEAPLLWTLDYVYDDVGWNQRSLLLQANLLQGWKRCEGDDSQAQKSEGQYVNLINPAGPMSYVIKTCLPCWLADDLQLEQTEIPDFEQLVRIGIDSLHADTASLSLAYALKHKGWPVRGVWYLLPPTHWARKDAERHLDRLSNVPSREHGESDLPRFAFDTHGFLPWWRHLRDVTKRQSENLCWENYFPSRDFFEKHAGPEARFVLHWFSLYLSRPRQGSLRCYVSPLTGLAQLVDCVGFTPNVPYRGESEIFPDNPIFAGGLEDLARRRIWEVPPSDKAQGDSSEHRAPGAVSEGHMSVLEDDMPGFVTKWVAPMLNWCKALRSLPREMVLPPRVMSRVFTRVISQFKVISNSSELPVTSWSVGQFLERWTCCLLNAMIIEEVDYQIYRMSKYKGVRLDRRVPINDLEPFINNLKLMNMEGLAEFTKRWLTCPLLLATVNRKLRNHLYAKSDDSGLFKTVWRYDPCNLDHVFHADIHTVLCGLMFEPENKDVSRSTSKFKADLQKSHEFHYPRSEDAKGA